MSLTGLLKLTGASLVVGMFAATMPRSRPLDEWIGSVPVLPYLVLVLASLWLSLALNLVGLAGAASTGSALVERRGGSCCCTSGS